MSNEAKASIREGLWRSFGTEDNANILRKVAHAIAKGSGGWTELLPGLVGILVSLLFSSLCTFLSCHLST